MSNYKEYFFSKGIIFIISLYFFARWFPVLIKFPGQAINYNFENENHQPDYSNLNYWAASPFKYDPSDHVSKDLKDRPKDSLADVFLFIQPLIQIAK